VAEFTVNTRGMYVCIQGMGQAIYSADRRLIVLLQRPEARQGRQCFLLLLLLCVKTTRNISSSLYAATNILKHYWRHICLTKPRHFVTFYISALEILLLTYLLTYLNTVE